MSAIETSKTHRLYLLLKERIRSGALRPGERLLGEQQLALTHQMSRVTVRRALQGLQHDGLIVRQPGSGTYVKTAQARDDAVVGDLSNMLASLVAMGKATGVRLLAFGYGAPPDDVAEALGLVPGERVQHALRVRTMEGEPFSYLSTYVPERIGARYSQADLARQPLLELLERSGVVAACARQTLSATLAGPDVAAALDVEIGAPLIALTRLVLDEQGRGVEYLSALYRPDRHRFHMHMTRDVDGGTRLWRAVDAEAPPPRRSGQHRSGRARRQRPT